MKIYEYKNCSTCQKAIKFLDRLDLRYEKIPIVDQPPTKAELKKMLEFIKLNGGTLKNLFNTSGVQYRELKVSEKFAAGLADDEALTLLAKNGKLIKRPFLIAEKFGIVGFKEDDWKKILKNDSAPTLAGRPISEKVPFKGRW